MASTATKNLLAQFRVQPDSVYLQCMSDHASHLMLEEAVLQSFVAWVAAGTLEQQLVLLKI